MLVGQMSAQKILITKLFLTQIAIGVHVKYFTIIAIAIDWLLLLIEVGGGGCGSGQRKRVRHEVVRRAVLLLLLIVEALSV